jgi:hypothetical protein
MRDHLADRARLPASLACFALGLTGCAAAGSSSFETLGVPDAQPGPGRAALVLGWAVEQRAGWMIRAVEVDGRAADAWDARTQRPAVLDVPPGPRVLRLRAGILRDPRRPDSGLARRVRLRAVEIDAREGEVLLCVVRVAGQRAPRPRVTCTGPSREGEASGRRDAPPAGRGDRARAGGVAEAGTEEVAGGTPPGPLAPAQAQPGGDAELLERLERLEQRLDRIEALLVRLVDGDRVSEPRHLEAIDTYPPW